MPLSLMSKRGLHENPVMSGSGKKLLNKLAVISELQGVINLLKIKNSCNLLGMNVLYSALVCGY